MTLDQKIAYIERLLDEREARDRVITRLVALLAALLHGREGTR